MIVGSGSNIKTTSVPLNKYCFVVTLCHYNAGYNSHIEGLDNNTAIGEYGYNYQENFFYFGKTVSTTITAWNGNGSQYLAYLVVFVFS